MQVIRDTKALGYTLGVLTAGPIILDTIEQPDNHDAPGHSCIPPGSYTLVEHVSGRLHEDDGKTPLRTWALVNPQLGITHAPTDPLPGGIGFPHRSECLIHPANFASQLEGCIAPGKARSKVLGTDVWQVDDSRAAFKLLRSYLDAHPEDRTLTISEQV